MRPAKKINASKLLFPRVSRFNVFNFLKPKIQLHENDPAPLFTTVDETGKKFNLKDRQGTWTVLYFYPKDDTPGCTKQACVFRDAIADIRSLGAEVYGISKDTERSHSIFKVKYKLNYPLLTDPDGEIIRKFGVNGLFGFAKRHTFILNPDLTIVKIMKSVSPSTNARDVCEALQRKC